MARHRTIERTRPMSDVGRTDPDATRRLEDRPAGTPGQVDHADPPRRRGRDLLFVLVGVVLGLAIALVVVALMTGDEADQVPEAEARVEHLEAEVADRDARIADLETRLAEAEAAAGGREQDIEEQRRALDARAAVLDEWSDALTEREAALAERERVLGTFPDLEVPGLDDEVVDNIVERILEQLRGWFR
jgi:uncharacterized protein HemX